MKVNSQPDAVETIATVVEEIRHVYTRDERPWILGYSGGKDSSAVLKLVFVALLGMQPVDLVKPVTVLYCDTGVEIPAARSVAVTTLHDIEVEAKASHLPIAPRLVQPELRDRYFVKVIGRGYPPPTNKFRWCTSRLRVKPVSRFLEDVTGRSEALALLGTRLGESATRDRTIARYSTVGGGKFTRQQGNPQVQIYAPITDFGADLVWTVLNLPIPPQAIDGAGLARLYRDADGECPIMRTVREPACGSGRFGCWTCTVVRRDRAMEGLVRRRDSHLRPLMEFRDWLLRVREEDWARERNRRNGSIGPGPFTVEARVQIARRLLSVEVVTGLSLLTVEERKEIERLWKLDGYVGPGLDEIGPMPT